MTTIPVTGFFEYGIAALLGAAAMIVMAIWALVAEGTRPLNDGSRWSDEEKVIPDHPPYKKAA